MKTTTLENDESDFQDDANSSQKSFNSVGLKNFKKKNQPTTAAPLPLEKIEEKKFEESTFENMKNMEPEELEFRLDHSMTSLIEQKNAKLFIDLEDQLYSKRLAETFKKQLVNDFEEANEKRDRLESILQREREIKRVFEKEVGKLKKDFKLLKTENDKLKHLSGEEDRKHTEKNLEDQRFTKLNDDNDALERMDYEILILKEKNNDLNGKVTQYDADLISCQMRMAQERVDYMNSLKDIKQASKEELEKNLDKISTMKDALASLQ